MSNHKFEPQCTETWQLYAEFSRVIKMCKEAGIEPGLGVKVDGCQWMRPVAIDPPHFNSEPNRYEFAIAIVEGKPVFRGDVLCEDDGRQLIVIGRGSGIYDGHLALKSNPESDYGAHTFLKPERLSWNPPQRTIEINGVKVKAANEIRAKADFGYAYPHGIIIRFAKEHDAEAFKAAMEGKK